MRWWIALFLCVMIGIGLAPVECTAQNSQGLYWRIDSETRYNFHFTFRYSEDAEYIPPDLEPIDADLYGVFENIPEIPDYIPSFSFPVSNAVVYWPNGTRYPSTGLYPNFAAIPVGNWTFIESIFTQQSGENLTIVNDAFTIGIELRFESEDTVRITKYHFSKSDGTTSLYEASSTDPLSGTELFLIRLSRGGPVIDPVSLVSSIVIAIEIIAVIVIIMKVRGSRG